MIIDSSEIVANAVKQLLNKFDLLNHHGLNKQAFYVSDYTESFAANAKFFFGDELTLEHYPLWD